MNGLNLAGADDENGCVMFMNTYGTAANITSVSFTVTDGPAGPNNPALHSGNADCPDRPTCVGARLVKDGRCEAGTTLPSGAPSGEYQITATAAFTFLCENATTDPCKNALKAGGPPPTPKDPVLIRASSTMTTEISGDGPPTTTPPGDNPPQPVNPPPDTPTTPTAPEQ
ncbi:hypothetical protein OG241_33715 [Streptomyces sp. NBC_01390]|uniref:hypothetical protein n=1 Tax=Streptomyces sp. NBC_01390 TaxID=2903850 RepID=UPI0032537BC2